MKIMAVSLHIWHRFVSLIGDRIEHQIIRGRQKRFAHFRSLLATLPRPVRILDVGGTQIFWERMGCTDASDVQVIIYNRGRCQVRYPNFVSMIGDARNMHEFSDGEFDVVFSNSVIEHVGGYDQQRLMAREIERVGQRYFIQTPNRYFPIEPHFLFPFFQFLPLSWRVFLVQRFPLGWWGRIADPAKARKAVSSIRLLSEREVRGLFPEAVLAREKMLGLTKSLIAYARWDEHHTD